MIRTQGQAARQHLRTKPTGRYSRGSPCELCGKPAPLADYSSLPGVPIGLGLILCNRASCVRTYAGMTELQVAEAIITKIENDNMGHTRADLWERLVDWADSHPEESTANRGREGSMNKPAPNYINLVAPCGHEVDSIAAIAPPHSATRYCKVCGRTWVVRATGRRVTGWDEIKPRTFDDLRGKAAPPAQMSSFRERK